MLNFNFKVQTYITDDLWRVPLEDYDLTCIAGTLKKYLRELPNPVIPEQYYNKFIEAASKYMYVFEEDLMSCTEEFQGIRFFFL